MKKTALALLVCCLLALCRTSPAEMSGPQREVDLDLTLMSGTVVYAQVSNMLYDAQPYLGKILRISGEYSPYEDRERGVVYHSCVIADATACCAQGLEFVWAGQHAWPGDYPEEGTGCVVTGRLEAYDEYGDTYLHLVDAQVVWEAAP